MSRQEGNLSQCEAIGRFVGLPYIPRTCLITPFNRDSNGRDMKVPPIVVVKFLYTAVCSCCLQGSIGKMGGVMLKIPLTVLSVLLGFLPPITLLAQVGANNPGAASAIVSDEKVLNIPYSAKRRFTDMKKLADGTIRRSEFVGSIARDSQGRTYSADERQVTYFDGKKNVLGSEMLYRIEDPVAQSETKWDTTSKIVQVIHWPQNTPKDVSKTLQAWLNPPSTVEKLGRKTIGGLVVEGTRSMYTVPAGQDHNEQPIAVVRDSWYCPELKIVILVTNDDPRSGSSRDELIDIVRGEPKVTQYRPPADYVVREVGP